MNSASATIKVDYNHIDLLYLCLEFQSATVIQRNKTVSHKIVYLFFQKTFFEIAYWIINN